MATTPPEEAPFPGNLKRFRVARGMTQDALADAVKQLGDDVKANTLSKYERGTLPPPPADRLRLIARALGVSTGDLLGEDEPREARFVPEPQEPLGALEHIEIAIKEAGLSPAAAQAFRDERRVGGMPYPLSVIIDIAKHRRVVELEAQAKPKFPKTREPAAEEIDDPTWKR